MSDLSQDVSSTSLSSILYASFNYYSYNAFSAWTLLTGHRDSKDIRPVID